MCVWTEVENESRSHFKQTIFDSQSVLYITIFQGLEQFMTSQIIWGLDCC